MELSVFDPPAGRPDRSWPSSTCLRMVPVMSWLYLSHSGEGVTDNTRFSISIDYFDVYDENGEKRDWSKLTYTILHEYGHVRWRTRHR